MSRLRVVVDIVGATPEHWAASLESLAVLLDEGIEGIEIRGVIHSHAWPLVAKPERGGAAELHEEAQALARRGVTLVLCENTMRGAKLGKRDLMPFVRTVSSAVGELVRKQTEGWAYLKP
ncbi:DsrE family protein [Armatimonas sp.]|uniref:DsrE family protein n=1 Tax=Armatimonas sp. TaxID=1872638 RepID=UPI00286B1589|nr:DsrE family protein [Armatimonas sp.]